MSVKTNPWAKKPKRKLADWTRAFLKQHKALRPENSKCGGIKARSIPETVRMEIYIPISELFKMHFPICQCCEIIHSEHLHMPQWKPRWTDDVHHIKGREGLLLFDLRWWKAACRQCHEWIGSHPKEAKELGLIKDRNL